MEQCSRSRLAYSDFWKMTPREWAAWVEGFLLREEDEWRRTRTICAIVYNCHAEPCNQLKPAEILPLPGDKEEEAGEPQKVKMLNDDERAEIKRKLGIKN